MADQDDAPNHPDAPLTEVIRTIHRLGVVRYPDAGRIAINLTFQSSAQPAQNPALHAPSRPLEEAADSGLCVAGLYLGGGKWGATLASDADPVAALRKLAEGMLEQHHLMDRRRAAALNGVPRRPPPPDIPDVIRLSAAEMSKAGLALRNNPRMLVGGVPYSVQYEIAVDAWVLTRIREPAA